MTKPVRYVKGDKGGHQRVKTRVSCRIKASGKNRLVVVRSNAHMKAYVVDTNGQIKTEVSTRLPAILKKAKNGSNKKAAYELGCVIGKKIKKLGWKVQWLLIVTVTYTMVVWQQ